MLPPASARCAAAGVLAAAVLLPLVLRTVMFQRQLVFLHQLRYPPCDYGSPATPYNLPWLPGISNALGLFDGLPYTTAHTINVTLDESIGIWVSDPPADGCESGLPPTFVLYCHGNGENRAWAPAVAKVRLLTHPPFCATVATFDYVGFGDSKGVPTEALVVQSALEAWRWLEARQPPSARGILIGHSLGSSAALQLAVALGEAQAEMNGTELAPRPPAAVVLEGALSSIADVVLAWVPQLPSSLYEPLCAFLRNSIAPEHRFESINFAHRLGQVLPSTWGSAPQLMLLHGTRDYIIPMRVGKKLLGGFDSSMRPKWIEVAGAGHENIFEYEQARAALRDLWTSVRTAPPGRRGAQSGDAQSVSAFETIGSWLAAASRGVEELGPAVAVLPPALVAAGLQIGLRTATRGRRARALHSAAHAAESAGTFLPGHVDMPQG